MAIGFRDVEGPKHIQKSEREKKESGTGGSRREEDNTDTSRWRKVWAGALSAIFLGLKEGAAPR